MKIALDTTVLVAGAVSAHDHHERAAWWLDPKRGWELCASWHALAETWATLTRIPIVPPVSPGLARQVVARLESKLTIWSTSGQSYREAIRRCSERGLRSGIVFDALHLVTARLGGAESFLTFNEDDFARVSEEGDPKVIVPPDPPGAPAGWGKPRHKR